MAKRKTEPETSEAVEFLVQGLDRRTSVGRRAQQAIMHYRDVHDSTTLGFLRDLKLNLGIEDITDIRFLEGVYYKRNVDGQCVCGRPLKHAFYVNYGQGKRRKLKVPIAVAEDHYKQLAHILDSWGEPEFRRRIEQGEKEKEERLEDLLLTLPASLKRRLATAGIDIDQLGKVISLEHAYALSQGDESGLRYDLDPGSNRNTFNWFREGIKEEDIQDEEVKDIWHRLNEAAHLVTDNDLAAIMQYSFEYRYRSADVLLGHVRDDLLFLARLPEDHRWVKKYGKIDLEQEYKLPRTTFRPPEDFYGKKREKRMTIREVLEREMITVTEAMGVLGHFPDIEKTRVAINRETAQRYGKGRTWDYLLRDIKPEFDEIKRELRGEYERYGAIKQAYGLTKDEYLTLKGFFERCDIGKRTTRDNYLRSYPVGAFLEVAPEIVTIGRKIRYTKEVVNATGADKTRIMKRDYALIEEVSEHFNELTGIESRSLDDVLDLLEHAEVKEKTFNAFQRDDLPEIRRMLKHGIIDKTYLRQEGHKTLRRNYDLVKSRDIDKFGKSVLEARDRLRKRYEQGLYHEAWFGVKKKDFFDIEKAIGSEYGDAALRGRIITVDAKVENLVRRFRKKGHFSFKSFKEDKKKAEGFYGKVVLIMRGEEMGRPDFYCEENFRVDYLIAPPDRIGPKVECFDPKEVKQYANMQRLTPEQLGMARVLYASSDVLRDRLHYSMSGFSLEEEIWATRATIKTIEGLYKRGVEEGLLT